MLLAPAALCSFVVAPPLPFSEPQRRCSPGGHRGGAASQNLLEELRTNILSNLNCKHNLAIYARHLQASETLWLSYRVYLHS